MVFKRNVNQTCKVMNFNNVQASNSKYIHLSIRYLQQRLTFQHSLTPRTSNSDYWQLGLVTDTSVSVTEEESTLRRRLQTERGFNSLQCNAIPGHV